MHTFNFTGRGPLFNSLQYIDAKDPCPVFDGQKWHVFGSGSSSVGEMSEIIHATALQIEGPWQDEPTVELIGVAGVHVATPGVIYDFSEGVFHMFVQTDFMALDSKIEHLISADGKHFNHASTVLHSIPNTQEEGIYDPHPAMIIGKKYISYSGFAEVGRPDIYLARSTTNYWCGPWERVGVILKHGDALLRDPSAQPDYEFGLKGSQLIALSDKCILLSVVCFLSEGERNSRQRVLFAAAENVEGPFYLLSPLLSLNHREWQSGNNRHASVVLDNDRLYLFYKVQSEGKEKSTYEFGTASIELTAIQRVAQKILSKVQ
ncbi:TPA: hypothetical protein DCQ44_03170 [Candidatus Taylorbacteria bacterium]|nr:hypothetical protein [Candidatus Taylorbacteria bacterium]